jgi:hypothetical protein
MLQGRHAEKTIIEDLVLVMINGYVLTIATKEAVPVVRWQKAIVKNDGGIRGVSNLTVSICIKLLGYWLTGPCANFGLIPLVIRCCGCRREYIPH